MSPKTFMNLGRRFLISSFVLLAGISSFGYFFWIKPALTNFGVERTVSNKPIANIAAKEVLTRLKIKSALAKNYVTSHGFSRNHCFFIDMRIPSGLNRFFIYNLKADSIEAASLVSHGSGSQTESDELVFSNTPNSYCTSLGRYKTGKSYYGIFGLAYKLYGLDETNDKAYNRCIVLHAHECVPAGEVFPESICMSLGCPMVSKQFLTRLSDYIKDDPDPLLLWIYY